MIRKASILAVLALLLAGSAGALERGEVKTATDKAENWLIRSYNPEERAFGTSRTSKLPWVQALVIQALCESPRQYRESLGPFISEPAKFLVECQGENGLVPVRGQAFSTTAGAIMAWTAAGNPARASAIAKAKQALLGFQICAGGFPIDNEEAPRPLGGLYETWLILRALSAAGAEKTDGVYQKALPFLHRCQDNPETNADLAGGKGGNTGGAWMAPDHAQPLSGTMTSALIESYILCGLPPTAPEVRAALKWLQKSHSVKEVAGGDRYDCFLYAHAFARGMTAAGVKELELPDGKKVHWAEDLALKLIAIQAKDGCFADAAVDQGDGMRVACTAYALQALTLCYEAMGK